MPKKPEFKFQFPTNLADIVIKIMHQLIQFLTCKPQLGNVKCFPEDMPVSTCIINAANVSTAHQTGPRESFLLQYIH